MTQSDLPPSSLIICTRNRPEMLCETLNSILHADEIPTEIIIIDQSDQRHAAFENFKTEHACTIRYVWTNIAGSSRARNHGIVTASHDILAFIDDDMFVDSNWYGALMHALIQAGSRAVITGRVAAAANENKSGFVIAVHDWAESKIYQGRIGRDILASGHMAMYRSAFEEVGGFDERLGPGTPFPGAEDNDYGFRLLEAGYQIVYVPDSVIYHRAWRTNREYVPLFWNYGRGQGAFYAKHFTWHDRYMLSRFGKDFSRYLQMLPERIFKRYLTQLLGSTAFILGILVGMGQWQFTQRRTRA